MRSGSKWPMNGPRTCGYACAYVNPTVFTSQSYDTSTSISISTRRTNMPVFLGLMLILMSTQFSLAYSCACAYACALVKPGLSFLTFLLRKCSWKCKSVQFLTEKKIQRIQSKNWTRNVVSVVHHLYQGSGLNETLFTDKKTDLQRC